MALTQENEKSISVMAVMSRQYDCIIYEIEHYGAFYPCWWCRSIPVSIIKAYTDRNWFPNEPDRRWRFHLHRLTEFLFLHLDKGCSLLCMYWGSIPCRSKSWYWYRDISKIVEQRYRGPSGNSQMVFRDFLRRYGLTEQYIWITCFAAQRWNNQIP